VVDAQPVSFSTTSLFHAPTSFFPPALFFPSRSPLVVDRSCRVAVSIFFSPSKLPRSRGSVPWKFWLGPPPKNYPNYFPGRPSLIFSFSFREIFESPDPRRTLLLSFPHNSGKSEEIFFSVRRGCQRPRISPSYQFFFRGGFPTFREVPWLIYPFLRTSLSSFCLLRGVGPSPMESFHFSSAVFLAIFLFSPSEILLQGLFPAVSSK